MEIPSDDKIVEFQKDVQGPLNEIKNDIDSQDLDRILTDKVYASLFLRWSHNKENAIKLAVTCLKWRKQNEVNDLSIESIGEDTFKKGYLFLLGRDLNGCRVLHFKAGPTEKKDKEKNMELLIYWLERIQRREPGKKVTFILDTTGSGITNSDMGFSKFIIDCFTNYFPCMLERMIIYNLPSILNAMWKLISKMLSKEQREVTVMCGKSEITNYIDVDNLPEPMGGKMKFEYSYPPFPDDLDS